ncbi:MAG: aspartate--tRNA ligase [Alphaproteobacteria bacterium]|jgi:aspartyl-tRNA synthetase|tara:strand:+ start:530 stop:2311 length:1782 start_codon:yes stop_codon:yes gene_type:complete
MQYRDHYLNKVNKTLTDKKIKVSGWVNRVRDHGNLLFIDLRDSTSLLQCVVDNSSKIFDNLSKLKNEDVISLEGIISDRTIETINKNLDTGEVELKIENFEYLSKCVRALPLEVNSEKDYGEEVRLKYRYLDLRRPKIAKNIILRSKLIDFVRSFMKKEGFMELATPILTAPSPEGARDYLVPSRIHKGSFYALPQAPQQFKQLFMASGIDRYFQIAPCFRDEDSRADRSPGEFYQIDMEMSFATQEQVLEIISNLLFETFDKFKLEGKKTNSLPFPTFSFNESLIEFGCDKPDLRNPLRLKNVTENFKNSGLKIFQDLINNQGAIVNCIQAKGSQGKPRSFFDNLNKWAIDEGKKGLGYINFENKEAKGPLAKNFNPEALKAMIEEFGFNQEDGLLFVCDQPLDSYDFASKVIQKLGMDLDLLNKNEYQFCWIIDYPMYEKNSVTGEIDFSHNPFSMPQGGMDALLSKDPLDVLAYQYDIVCNGIELSSGAIRNHQPEVMLKAFQIAGYKEEDIKSKFSALYEAFHYGVPPHGGCAPGLDRILMLLTDNENIREVIAFPFNQKAQDLMMNAPVLVDEKNLKELGLKKITEKP